MWVLSTDYFIFDEVVVSRSSHRRCSVKTGVLRHFAKFIGKHLCWSLFFNKVAGLRKKTLPRVTLPIL